MSNLINKRNLLILREITSCQILHAQLDGIYNGMAKNMSKNYIRKACNCKLDERNCRCINILSLQDSMETDSNTFDV